MYGISWDFLNKIWFYWKFLLCFNLTIVKFALALPNSCMVLFIFSKNYKNNNRNFNIVCKMGKFIEMIFLTKYSNGFIKVLIPKK